MERLYYITAGLQKNSFLFSRDNAFFPFTLKFPEP